MIYVQHDPSQGNITVAVLLDIKRAYDTVSRDCGLSGLLQLKVCCRTSRWIGNSPSARNTFVTTSSGISTDHILQPGVPEGNALSCLLFHDIMIELPGLLPQTINIFMHTDDLCNWSSGISLQTVQQRLQTELDNVDVFLMEGGIVLSPKKACGATFPFKQHKCISNSCKGQ